MNIRDLIFAAYATDTLTSVRVNGRVDGEAPCEDKSMIDNAT